MSVEDWSDKSLETIVSQIFRRGQSDPESIAFSSLSPGRDTLESEEKTVRELINDASRVANSLRDLGLIKGDRALLALSDPDDFIVTFLALLTIGALPVPLPALEGLKTPKSFLTRFEGVQRDCEPSLVIARDRAQFQNRAGTLGLQVVEVGELLLGELGKQQIQPDIDLDSPAFLQYTSGSTGAPRGVVVTHKNLAANCLAISQASGFSKADRMISWLPLHHDMGLIGGVLSCLCAGVPTYILPTLDFMMQPSLWLGAISQFAGTLSVAPTFAYSLVSKRVSERQLANLDLSSWRLAYVGAEPISWECLDRFMSRYQPCGFSPTSIYPVYGLAEATLAVAFPKPGAGAITETIDRQILSTESRAVPVDMPGKEGMTVVSVGQVVPGHQVTIRIPESLELCDDGHIGELVFEGPSVSPGYYGEHFHRQGELLRTGDLGYINQGELFILDRIKDLIIIAGQNFAPNDIENEVSRVKGLRKGRILAFAAKGEEGTEEMVIVAEVRAGQKRSVELLRSEVKAAALEIGVSASRVSFAAAGTLLLTSSGKLRRRASAQAFQTGQLKTIKNNWDLFRYAWSDRFKRLGLGFLFLKQRFRRKKNVKIKR